MINYLMESVLLNETAQTSAVSATTAVSRNFKISGEDSRNTLVQVTLSAVNEVTGLSVVLQDSPGAPEGTTPTFTAAKSANVSSVANVDTINFADKSATANGDYFTIHDTNGAGWAVALTKPIAEVQTMTVPNGAIAAASKDFMIITDGSGLTWATYFDTSGTDTAPAAAAYTAVNAARKIKTDITVAADNAAIVTAMKSALNGLTGFTAAVTLSGTTTLIATMVVKAPCTDPVIFAADGIAAATSFSGVQTTGGIAAQTPTGALWTAVASGKKTLVDMTTMTNDEDIAAAVLIAMNALVGFTDVITITDPMDGTLVMTSTGGGTDCAAPTRKTFNDGANGSIAVTATTPGSFTAIVEIENNVYNGSDTALWPLARIAVVGGAGDVATVSSIIVTRR